MKLVKGTWYFVTWTDAATESIGDVREAQVYYRTLPLRFVRWATKKYDGLSCRYAIFATIREESDTDTDQVGWWAIPQGMLKRVVPAEESDRERGTAQSDRGGHRPATDDVRG